ncbi:MAG: RnfABCDGE type electron transport complex subunit D [Oscillospiraceae bacterium]|nr:RnfABCDGE type electron transport complex subunit D [Oscillospiraceae bacterium]
MSDKKERIILDVAYQPQVRTAKDTKRLMLDVIIALIPAIIVGVLQFGLYPLVLLLTGVCSAVFWEWGYRRLFKKDASIGDLSAALTGLLLGLTMPPSAPWWLPVIGTFFGIVVVKQLYGGIGKNFLNPALAGRAFLFSSYATIMATWSVPNALSGTIDGTTMATPLSGMYGEGLPAYFTAKSMFMGYLPGCIGEISAFALLLGGAYLIWRNVISWRIPVSFIGTVALVTLIFGKSGYSNGQWMLYNLFSGSLMLGAIFMATDYATSPVTLNGQLVYGVGCGLLTVLIRYFGGFPEGTTYAILIMNLCTWAIDKAFHRHQFGVSKADIAFKKAEKLAAKEAAKYE